MSKNWKIGQLVKRGGELLIFFWFSSYREFVVRVVVFVCPPKNVKKKRNMSNLSKSGQGFTGKFVKNTSPASKKRRQGTLQPIHTIHTIQLIQLKWCQQVRSGTYFLHAPGTKMTWVHKQTPSNYFPLYHLLSYIIVPSILLYLPQSFIIVC